MPKFGSLGKFFGRTVSEGAAFAAGVAVAPTLSPAVEEVRQEAWRAAATKGVGTGGRSLDAGTAAAIVAEDVERESWGQREASYDGINAERFVALLGEALNAPGLSELFAAWRRGLITEADFTHGLRKMKLEPRWDVPLKALKSERLDPAVIANAIVRGLIPDPDILPVGPPTAHGKVPAFPVFPVDAIKEAAASGIDRERLSVMVGLDGRPMSLHEAASAYFRGIIERADYERAVAEGDTRNEWRDAILDQARQIPSVTNYVEAHVRDWIREDEMHAGAARHGMTQHDANLLFLVHGRPLTHAQVFIGLLRGGIYDGPTTDIDPHFLKSLRESDMRPEWYNLAWHARYHFPPFFQTLNALNKGWIDAATATDWLLKQAYDPDAVRTIIENVAGGAPAAPDKHVTSAQTKLLTRIHAGFVKGELTESRRVVPGLRRRRSIRDPVRDRVRVRDCGPDRGEPACVRADVRRGRACCCHERRNDPGQR